MKIKLLIKSRSGEKTITTMYDLSQDYLITGRKDADVLINDELCSKKHALLYQSFEGFLKLKDLSSKNGTFLNGAKITDSRVSIGDSIRIGKSLVTVLEYVPAKATKSALKFEKKSSFQKKYNDTKTNVEKVVIHSWPEKFKATPQEQKAEFVYFIDGEGTKNKIDISSLKPKYLKTK